ncbi:MAG: hypothetical protein H6721_17325 [Sandaracinus sp.]|nr:hypothetical protein [Sandaracinus sp.]
MRLLALALFFVATTFATSAVAQPASRAPSPPAEAPAPPLESQLDRRVEPWTGYGLSVDAVGAVFGAYDLRIDVGLTRHVGVGLMPGWRRRDGVHGPSLGGSVEVWPLGRGLDGLALGVEAQLAWFPGRPDRGLFSTAGYVAYRHVWRGVLAGAGVGLRHERGLGSDAQSLANRLSPLVAIWLGWGLEG